MLPGTMVVYARQKCDSRKNLDSLTSRELVIYGEECLSERSSYAYALEAFSLVINRYYRGDLSMPTAVDDAVAALHHVGTLYLVSYFKYDKAYKYLALAQNLAEENHVSFWLPYTYINLANLWEINKMTFPGTSYNGLTYISDAWKAAVAGNNEDLLPTIAFNMAILTYTCGSDSLFKSQMSDFLDYKFSKMTHERKVAKNFVKGVRCWMSKNYEEGESYLLSSLNMVKGEAKDIAEYSEDEGGSDMKRRILSILSALAEFYISVGRYDSASAMLREYGFQAKENPDFTIDLYELYMKYFKAMNLSDSVGKYHYLYLKGKEAIANESKLYEVGEKLFIDKIEKANEEVISLAGKNRKQRMQLSVAVVALMLLLTLIVVALWAYIRLRNKSAQLYRKNVEMIEEQIQFSLKQKQLQDEVERLRAIVGEGSLSGGKTDSGDCEEVRRKLGPRESSTTKHQPRGVVSEPDAEILYSRIVAVMENGGEVYQSEFSLERLSVLVESRPRVVSQVINKCSGCNFSQFLNEYRIREACLRFQNVKEYGNYTVEAISESVGYKSRTGFSSLFKKATGLSPSEYHRQAKRASDEQRHD